MKRVAAISMTAACLLLAGAATASAGGWAAISFEEVPTDLEAGTARTVGFTVLAHGVTPVDAGDDVEVRLSGEGGTHTFAATPGERRGHYTVDITLPTAGEWRWEVDTHMYPVQRLGTISVAPAPAPAPAGGDGPLQPILRTVLPLATLLTLALSLVLFRRSGGAIATAADGA